MKYFNTLGPVNPQDHYHIPDRLPGDTLQQLIDKKKYFIIHAPCKSGKTTAIHEFTRTLNMKGMYKSLCINVAPAQTMRNNVLGGIFEILAQCKLAITDQYGEHDVALDFLKKLPDKHNACPSIFTDFLQFLCLSSKSPIVLFIDNIDSLIGDTLLSVLHQVGAGYALRSHMFPQSVGLVGTRDVRDYHIWSREKQSIIQGSSVFDIQLEPFSLPNFMKEQVQELYAQHTRKTGQQFTDEAIDYAFKITQGQPWLINALAYQACFRETKNYSKPITQEIFEQAQEALLDAHTEGFTDYQQQPLARTVIDTIIERTTNDENMNNVPPISGVEDIKKKALDIANFIYQDIIPGSVRYTKQKVPIVSFEVYQNIDGSLNMHKVLEAFQGFYQEHSMLWLPTCPYLGSRPYLFFVVFLQCIINGIGTLDHTYVAETHSVRVVLLWGIRRMVIILKKISSKSAGEKTAELYDIAQYVTTQNGCEGHVVLFYGKEDTFYDKKLSNKKIIIDAKEIAIWEI
jgi:hypothetical protein